MHALGITLHPLSKPPTPSFETSYRKVRFPSLYRVCSDRLAGRFDGALAKVCFELLLETFNRTVARDLGPRSGQAVPPPNVC